MDLAFPVYSMVTLALDCRYTNGLGAYLGENALGAYLGENALGGTGGTCRLWIRISGDLLLSFCDIMDDVGGEWLICMFLSWSCWASLDWIVLAGDLLFFACHFRHQLGISLECCCSGQANAADWARRRGIL